MTDAQTSDPSNDHLMRLARAPVVVFLMVAAADGNIDKKELKQFGKTLLNEDFAILSAAMQQCGLPLQEIIADAKPHLADPMKEFAALTALLDGSFPADAGKAYKVALLLLGKAIAEASGGFLGMFGSKIDKSEKIALALIAHALGFMDNAGGAPNAVAQAAQDSSEPLLADNLYPAFKPAAWAEAAKDAVAMQCIYANGETLPGEPVVGYVFDRPETVEFLGAASISEGCTLEQIHAKAMSNLERRLEKAGDWEEMSFDAKRDDIGEVKGLTMFGDYFAAEALLSEKIMQAAHERMDSAMLMAIAPARGELYVTKLLSENLSGDLREETAGVLFAHFALARFFNPEQAPIAPSIWIVRNGRVVGTVAGMDAVIESARKSAENREERENTLLEHKAVLTSTANGKELQVVAVAKDIDVMLRNLQHVVRAYVAEAIESADFDGSVRVIVEITADDYHAGMHGEISASIDDMCSFLTKQFVALQTSNSDGNPITVSGVVAESAAA